MTKSLLFGSLLVLAAPAAVVFAAPAARAQSTIVPGQWAEDLGWGTGPQDYNAANASGVPGYWINGAAPRRRALLSEGYGPMAYRPMPNQSCDPNTVAISDEYGFKYNCRGARLR